MGRDCTVTYSHCRNLCKRRLHCCHQLCLKLAFNLTLFKIIRYISTDVGIEQQGICDLVGILSVASDGNINIKADILVYHSKGHRIGCSVLISHDLLGIKIINSLILCGISAKGETLSDCCKGLFDIFT